MKLVLCRSEVLVGLLAALVGYMWHIGALLPSSPAPTDPAVAALDERFQQSLDRNLELAVSTKGMFFRDRDMLFWWRFADNFGANPNTPYMFNALPFLGFLLPSPIWSLGPRDAVVLLARLPPKCEYFSLTTYAMFMPRYPPLPFASLGDSINHANIKHDAGGLFAHVVTASQRTYDQVAAALAASGLPATAINLSPVPSEMGLLNDVLHVGGQVRLGTYFEVLARLFRFENQTAGDAFLHSFPPVYYLRADHTDDTPLSASREPRYASRTHPQSVDERPLAAAFDAHAQRTVEHVAAALGAALPPPREPAPPPPPPPSSSEPPPSAPSVTLEVAEEVAFAPLKIRGLDCLQRRTKCLGDGPDAAYFAPNVHEDADAMELLRLETDDEVGSCAMLSRYAMRYAMHTHTPIKTRIPPIP